MCGICGLIDFREGGVVESSEIERMMGTLAHRGPDADGCYLDGAAGLGHRRLSIIDLSDAGRQPMSNEDGSIWITYNGEFYNYADYVGELKRDGHQFRSGTDTEVILHLYEKYGLAETLRRMYGMFAFCLWDKRKNVHYFVRDRLGIKPLYLLQGRDRIAFASEIKAFYVLKDFQPVLLEDRLPELFLFDRPGDGATLLRGVTEVQPGTYVELKEGSRQECRWYDLSRIRQRSRVSMAEALDEFDHRLEVSIRRRLVSDVPVGVFLSGGIDSTILAVKTAELVGEPINTISVAYPEESANEFKWSDQVAARIKSNHRKFQTDAEDFFRLYPWVTYIHDKPTLTGAAFFRAAQVAKPHCTVMLCGQGSDEIFCGYTRYMYARWQNRLNGILAAILPGSARADLSGMLQSAGSGKFFRKVAARLNLSESEVAASYAGSLAEADFCGLHEGASPQEYRRLLGLYAARFPGAEQGDFLNRMLLAELYNGLQEILQQTDRMTMAAGVETRVPFLDHELVEFAFSLPSSLKVRGRDGKHMLKQYLLRYFPPEFIYRKKMGFPNPFFDWFQQDESPLHRLAASAEPEIAHLFNRDYLGGFMRTAQSGRLGRSHDILDPLMKFIAFHVWWRMVKESHVGNPPAL